MNANVKDKKLRSMLVDCLKEHKKQYGYWYERPYTKHTFLDICTQHNDITLQDLIDRANEEGKSYKDTVVSGYSQEDYDGYNETFVYMEYKRKATDEEWFEEISESLSPQHELNRWNQYLTLKKEFEEWDTQFTA